LPLELFRLATCFASVRSLVASLKTVVLDGEVVLITPRILKIRVVERAGQEATARAEHTQMLNGFVY